jgi:uncharacterized membrane protein
VTASVAVAKTSVATAGVRCRWCDLPSADGTTRSWPMANAILNPATSAVWAAPARAFWVTPPWKANV